MKKVIKLTESDLELIVSKVLREQTYDKREYDKATNLLNKFPGSKPNINPKNLKKGDGGKNRPGQKNDVIALQQKLIDLGLLKTKTGKPTGYFGSLTQAALDNYNGTKTTPEKEKKVAVISDRQKNINSTYCSSEGGVVIAPGSKSNGMKWNDWVKKYSVTPQEIETAKKSCSNVKKDYKLTPRIDRELEYIKMRGYDNKPFFIYDPKQNLIYLFNKGGVLVDYSQVVDGADEQKNRSPMSSEEWCKVSGLGTSPYLCTDEKSKQRKNPSYGVLASLADRFMPKGIYSVSSIYRHEGYAGAGANTIRLKDEQGRDIAAAIHGVPDLPERLKASADLEKLLKKDLSSGKVPKEYMNAISKIANANQSFGCVGVPAKFIENPKVQELAKTAWLFVMGEGTDYLVQNTSQFFDKLSSDGQNCVNPSSLAQRMSNMA